MHLIYQGIVKSVIEFSFLFITHYKNKQIFKTNVSDTIQQLKMIQCSFCRIEKFSINSNTNVAGWIAENYVALSRFFVHIMSHVTDIVDVQDNITMIYSI